VAWPNKLSPNTERRGKAATDQQDDQYTARCAIRIVRRLDQGEGEDSQDQRDDCGKTKRA
jgi:hypothetical protein